MNVNNGGNNKIYNKTDNRKLCLSFIGYFPRTRALHEMICELHKDNNSKEFA